MPVPHLLFALPDEAAAGALRQRLSGFGIEATPVTRFGQIANMLFLDNNDQLVETTWRERGQVEPMMDNGKRMSIAR